MRKIQLSYSPRQYQGGPLKGTLLSLTYGSLPRNLIERVYVPQGPPNPTSYIGPRGSCLGFRVEGSEFRGFRV